MSPQQIIMPDTFLSYVQTRIFDTATPALRQFDSGGEKAPLTLRYLLIVMNMIEIKRNVKEPPLVPKVDSMQMQHACGRG